MHYVIGDIHNEAKKLRSILSQINMEPEDELILLGDLFDRGGIQLDPVGVYLTLSEIKGKCSWIRGNHDQWLADYIDEYFSQTERQKKRMTPYSYNTFELMKERLTEADMISLADKIHKLPLQKELIIDGNKYLFAHAMTSYPNVYRKRDYYMMGNCLLDTFFHEGIDGYISFVGHTPTGNIVWSNLKKNVYLMDCGCGFENGRLACMCIETGKRYYS